MTSPAALPVTRREFLRASAKGVGLLAFSAYAPAFVVRSVAAEAPVAERDRTVLVLVQLAGGNDGLNTVVPRTDANYHRLRPTLALKGGQVLPLDEHCGLNAACAPLHRLYSEGRLCIVQNVGYPNPNRSHFRSMEIWETASESGEFLPTGWLGRYFDSACSGAPGDPCAVNISNELPQSFLAAQDHRTFSLAAGGRSPRGGREGLALLDTLLREPGLHAAVEPENAGYLRHTMMDALVTERRFQQMLAAYRPDGEYPATPFANSLRSVAALIAGGTATRVYYVSLSGFDTHANQLATQQGLLTQLGEGLAAFQRDLAAKRLDGQVMTMTFSEFGRRPTENESRGTDHGTAAPLFVMGGRVKGGLHGTAPDLRLERNQDLKFTTDFRAVYATVLEKWLGCPAASIVGDGHPPLAFV